MAPLIPSTQFTRLVANMHPVKLGVSSTSKDKDENSVHVGERRVHHTLGVKELSKKCQFLRSPCRPAIRRRDKHGGLRRLLKEQRVLSDGNFIHLKGWRSRHVIRLSNIRITFSCKFGAICLNICLEGDVLRLSQSRCRPCKHLACPKEHESQT